MAQILNNIPGEKNRWHEDKYWKIAGTLSQYKD